MKKPRVKILTWTLLISFAALGALLIVHLFLNAPGRLREPPVVVGGSPDPASENSIDRTTQAPQDESLQELLNAHLAARTIPPSALATWEKSLAITNQQVQKLRQETTADSLAHLWDVGMFYTATAVNDDGSITCLLPIDGFTGSGTIRRILSNRRVLKLMFELSEMPRSEADRLVASQIKETMARYEDAFNKQIGGSGRLREVDARVEGGFSFQISDNDDGTPTFQGLRLSLLALVYVAGVLELDDEARVAVGSVVDTALRQRDFFYGHSENRLNPLLAAEALVTAGLYERQVLAVALAGTGHLDIDFVDQARSRLPKVNPPPAAESNNAMLKVPRFDSLTTPFEAPSSSIPPDFSRGMIEVPCCPYVDDNMFDQVVEQWRQQ